MTSHPVEGTTLLEVDAASRICDLYNSSFAICIADLI